MSKIHNKNNRVGSQINKIKSGQTLQSKKIPNLMTTKDTDTSALLLDDINDITTEGLLRLLPLGVGSNPNVDGINSSSDIGTDSEVMKTQAQINLAVKKKLIDKISTKYGKYIIGAAKSNGVSSSLIAAIILQESRGNKNARNGNKGGRGLMQIENYIQYQDKAYGGTRYKESVAHLKRLGSSKKAKPADKYLANMIGSKTRDQFQKKLYSPRYNIKFGARLLSYCINKKGSIWKGVKKYNGSGDANYVKKIKDNKVLIESYCKALSKVK